MIWLPVIVALAIVVGIGVFVRSDLTARKRQYEKTLREHVEAVDRYVDVGVVLHVVVADSDGEELLPGKPKMRIVRTHRAGGLLDTKANPPAIVGPSRAPVTWYCSEDQEPVILHADTDPLGQLVYGSEGAGKTTALAMWHYFRWLEHLGAKGAEGGQTAPNSNRLDLIKQEIFRLYPARWYAYRVAEDVLTFVDGTRIRFKSTYQQSRAGGAPIQGFNWWWCGRDEMQDQIAAHQDIESRGRSAPGGRYKQLATCTAKQTAAFRNLRDLLLASNVWRKRTLLIKNSPFVSPSFLADKAKTMTKREFDRRYGALDLAPELATYHTWDREKSLVTLMLGAEDLTESLLAGHGPGFALLGGHDPGELFDVTILLKAYAARWKVDGRIVSGHAWHVVDEITTENNTTEHHVEVLLRRLRTQHQANLLDRHGIVAGKRVFIRCDPYGNGSNASKPDRSCYTVFRNGQIKIEPAEYNREGNGPGVVPKSEGIELVNTLICNAAGQRRLFVQRDEQGQPVAPRLVQTLEESEKDYRGRAETQAKDKNDLSHWGAALRYALWRIERPRLQMFAGGRA